MEDSMNNFLIKIIKTSNKKALGIFRIFLGIMFVMTGLMKLLIPMLHEAFSGQLIAAGLPFYTFNLWFVPIVEVVIGVTLLIGLYSRISALIVIGIMLVATYVHMIVSDPSLFPLQPTEPIIPIINIVISLFILRHGGGAWSKDLKFKAE